MFEAKMKTFTTLLAAIIFLTLTGSAFAMQDQAPPAAVEDPIAQLRLTPEQRQRIRMILEETKAERQMTNRRVREANVALDQALDIEPIDDNLIEQRINEFAAAQAAQTRMRIHFEIRIRRELRPEQLAILKRLHLQVRDVLGAQQAPNRLNVRPGREALRPNQRNTVAPTFPHRNIRQP
jgi:Spy/CpxP family protein refolding chaperone